MSAGSARKFLDRIANDAQFRENVVKTMDQKTNNAAAIMALAAHAGYTFTASEISEVLTVFAPDKTEMSEVELQAVAGGFNPQPEPPIVYNNLRNLFRPAKSFNQGG